MAPAGRAVVVLALCLLYLCGAIISTEYISTLSFFNGENNERGCGPASEWEDFSPDCDPSVLQLEDPECVDGDSVACESVFSLNAEKILDYVAAMDDFQQSLELKRNQPIAMLYKGLTFFHRGLLKNHLQSLQLRGMMLYHHGSLQDAISNFKRCLQLEPYNEVCQYMKGLSHVAMGQFYEGIKAQTKVMLNDPLLGQKASSEYLKVKYLREYSRYLHSHLDIPVTEYNVDQDLPGNFKNHWAKNLPFLIEDYEEQPGLQPHIKGQIINIRYMEYFDSILEFIKDRILVYHGAYNPRGVQEVKQALENVIKVEDLLPIMKDSDAVCNLVLSLVYYFCNLMPLSRGSSLPSWYQDLPSVSETFQYARTMIEALNTDSSSHCPKTS
ncbi:Tetratricopeptide repeat protein 13 [Bagarius yarrelli]|uniref:Tetratricopeptide repeat protein 13 n=1 Tax=Bagarius yarrelli TaxID=175774 RepID=A0A556TZB6_BAGYA|nr:Tetratricopeptide repeat protein 13 [Bagarius yarrelli]